MFEFTLSKVNMLIFVTAIAVVVIFFMNSLNDNLKTRQSYETAYKVGKEIKSLFDSDSFCSIKFIDIPQTINTNTGNLSSGISYKFGLQSYEQMHSESLIVFITDYKEENILGAYNFDYNGKINFFSAEHQSGTNYNYFEEQEDFYIYDPRKLNTNETRFLFIKNILNNERNYYIIPCGKRFSIDTCKEFVCDIDNGFDRTEKNIKCLENFCREDMS